MADSLVFERIELVLTRHHDDDGTQSLEDFDRVALSGEHVSQAPVAVWGLVTSAAAEDHPRCLEPLLHHLRRYLACIDDLTGERTFLVLLELSRTAVPLPRCLGARHDTTSAMHRGEERCILSAAPFGVPRRR